MMAAGEGRWGSPLLSVCRRPGRVYGQGKPCASIICACNGLCRQWNANRRTSYCTTIQAGILERSSHPQLCCFSAAAICSRRCSVQASPIMKSKSNTTRTISFLTCAPVSAISLIAAIGAGALYKYMRRRTMTAKRIAHDDGD